MVQTAPDVGAEARAGPDRLVFHLALAALVAAAFGHLPEVAEANGMRLYSTPLTILLLLVAASAWVITAWRGERRGGTPAVAALNDASRPGVARVLVPLLSYGLVVAAGILYSQDPSRSVETTKGFVISAVQLVTIVLLVTSRRALRTVAWAIVTTALLLAAVNLIQYATGQFDNEYFGLARPVRESPGGVPWALIGGPFGDPNYLAQRLVVAIPIAVWLIAASSNWLLRVAAGGVATVCGAAMVVSESRGGLVALLIVGVLLIRSLVPQRLHAAAGLVLVSSLVLLALPAQTRDAFASVVNEAVSIVAAPNAEASGRAREWRVAAFMYADNPVLGVGAGNFASRYIEYATKSGADLRPQERTPHNIVLEVLTETGLVGLAAFGALVIGAFGAMRRARLWTGQTSNVFGLVDAFRIGLAGYLVAGMFLGLVYSDLLWILLGTAFAVTQIGTGSSDRRLRPAKIRA